MADESPKPAVVLLSGGLDSATCLAIASQAGYAAHAMAFDYGQRHRVELNAAERQAQAQGVASFRRVTIDREAFGGFRGSALTDDIAVPKDRDEPAALPQGSAVPVTYVPARNALFLSYALALAETLGSGDIFIGVNAVDYSGYPDCRPEFVAAYEAMANLATKAGAEGRRLKVHAPLIAMTKTQIIARGLQLGVDYGLTHSCYDPLPDPAHPLEARPCGHCDSCLLRLRAFEKLGMQDPAAGGS